MLVFLVLLTEVRTELDSPWLLLPPFEDWVNLTSLCEGSPDETGFTLAHPSTNQSLGLVFLVSLTEVQTELD